MRRREGRYRLRTNLAGDHPAELWNYFQSSSIPV